MIRGNRCITHRTTCRSVYPVLSSFIARCHIWANCCAVVQPFATGVKRDVRSNGNRLLDSPRTPLVRQHQQAQQLFSSGRGPWVVDWRKRHSPLFWRANAGLPVPGTHCSWCVRVPNAKPTHMLVRVRGAAHADTLDGQIAERNQTPTVHVPGALAHGISNQSAAAGCVINQPRPPELTPRADRANQHTSHKLNSEQEQDNGTMPEFLTMFNQKNKQYQPIQSN